MRLLEGTTLWVTRNFAKTWFTDALREARSGPQVPHRDALRREIVFAVCFVESFLVEWTRDAALKGRFHDLSRYFPPDDRRGIRKRWKEVIRDLHHDGLLRSRPDFGTTVWTDFCRVIDYRDGLIHASMSRPESPDLPPGEVPSPSAEDLGREERGFAVRRVVALVRQLHGWAGTTPPAWLQEP
jgi:hypothetical protein